MNIENITRLQKVIQDNPDGFDMNCWCGTAQCLSGWAYTLETGKRAAEDDDTYVNHLDLANFLDISKETAEVLATSGTFWNNIFPELRDRVEIAEQGFDDEYEFCFDDVLPYVTVEMAVDVLDQLWYGDLTEDRIQELQYAR